MLRALLMWPLVFETYLALGLLLAKSSSNVRIDVVRWSSCLICVDIQRVAARLTGASSDMPRIWALALGLPGARICPPCHRVLGSPPNLACL